MRIIFIIAMVLSFACGSMAMEIKPNEVRYEKSKDPNIIIRYRLDVSEIHLDKLDQRIEILERKVEAGESTDKWYGEKVKELKALREDLKKIK